MSTSAAYGLKKNGVIKSSYCHSEGWLTSLGKDLINEFKKYGEDALSNLFDAIILVDKDDVPTKEDIAGSEISSFGDENWYFLLKDYQGSFSFLLKSLKSGYKKVFMVDEPIDGQNLSYLIDFDDRQFVYYKDKEIYNKVSFDIINDYSTNTIICNYLSKEELIEETKNTPTNLGKCKEEIIYELLLSLNQGNVGSLTDNYGYMPKIKIAIEQYNALVEKGIVREF